MNGESLALASAISWGISATMLKMVSPRFGAVYIVAVRSVAGLLFALVVAAVVGAMSSLGDLAIITVGVLVLSGVANIVGHLSFVKALSIDQISRIFPAANGLFIMFSTLGTIIVSDESVTWRTVAGGFLVLVGIYVLSARQQQDGSQRGPEASFGLLALVLSVLAGLAWALSVLLQNEVVRDTSPVLASAVRTVAMVVISMSMVAMSRDRPAPRGSRRDNSVIFGSGLISGLSALLFISALKFSSPATVVVLSSTSPLFAAPMAFLVLHERMTRKLLLGTATSVAGVALTVS